jgi:5-hydroxyisourate hydrolase
MAGALTTHALDTARGTGAAGLRLTLRRISPEPKDFAPVTLDAGGRATLLEGAAFTAGVYEISFFAATYQKEQGMTLPEPPFYDEIPVRFGVDRADTHYHVPLILSPFGYSTYRGG